MPIKRTDTVSCTDTAACRLRCIAGGSGIDGHRAELTAGGAQVGNGARSTGARSDGTTCVPPNRLGPARSPASWPLACPVARAPSPPPAPYRAPRQPGTVCQDCTGLAPNWHWRIGRAVATFDPYPDPSHAPRRRPQVRQTVRHRALFGSVAFRLRSPLAQLPGSTM